MASEKAAKLNEPKLKRLTIVKKLFDIVCLMYDAAKKKSEPFKHATDNVESFFNHEMFKTLPETILFFFDDQVHYGAQIFEKISPSTVKTLVKDANKLMNDAVDKGEKLVGEVINSDLRAGYEYAATESRLIFVAVTVKAWIMLDYIPMVGKFAIHVVKTCAAKYNNVIEMSRTAVKDIPLVPVEKINEEYDAKLKEIESTPKKDDVKEELPCPSSKLEDTKQKRDELCSNLDKLESSETDYKVPNVIPS